MLFLMMRCWPGSFLHLLLLMSSPEKSAIEVEAATCCYCCCWLLLLLRLFLSSSSSCFAPSPVSNSSCFFLQKLRFFLGALFVLWVRSTTKEPQQQQHRCWSTVCVSDSVGT
jgi:hypothetical protein